MSTGADAPPDAASGDPNEAPAAPPAAPFPPSATSVDPPTGWVIPAGGADGPSRRRPLLIGCLLIGVALFGVLLVAGPLIATAVLDQSGSSGPDLTSVGFDAGTSGCTLTDAASTFRLGVPIHSVLTMTPALPTGGTVKIAVEKDGTEIVEARQTITMTEPAPCIWGTLPELEVGHYRMTYEIRPSSLPPVTGEFDVTP
jgi:hypothetical protein